MLTKKQRELLLFIHARVSQGEIVPSFDEMKDALGLKSKSGIHRLITALVERGYLERLPNRARALEIKRLPDTKPPLSNDNAHVLMSTDATIPLMGKIAAGTPIEAIRDEVTSVKVPHEMLGSGSHYALLIEGDSMIQAGIHDGDTVIIRACDKVENGDIAVALVDGEEATLKRFFKTTDQAIILRPENDQYSEQRFSTEKVAVQGKLVGLLRRY